MKHLARLSFALLMIGFIVSCKPAPVSHWFPVTPQEHYERALYKDKIEKTQAGQTWFRVGQAVFNDSVFSSTPYQERIYLGDSVPAQAIRLKVPEGRKLLITPLQEPRDTAAHLFVELYKIKSNGKPQRLEYMTDEKQTLTYTNENSDTLLLRLQTGVNEETAVSVLFTTLPALEFPVSGHSMSSLISFWGADRDGGSRSHEESTSVRSVGHRLLQHKMVS